MHFVVGGAFNGKAKWVKNYYNSEHEIEWRSAYKSSFQKELFENLATDANCLVLEGMEYYIKANLLDYGDSDYARQMINKQLDAWLQWEQVDKERTLIMIGNDLSKGIVPVNKEERLWRDVTGWCYQDITSQASRVDIIWYGIATQLK